MSKYQMHPFHYYMHGFTVDKALKPHEKWAYKCGQSVEWTKSKSLQLEALLILLKLNLMDLIYQFILKICANVFIDQMEQQMPTRFTKDFRLYSVCVYIYMLFTEKLIHNSSTHKIP